MAAHVPRRRNDKLNLDFSYVQVFVLSTIPCKSNIADASNKIGCILNFRTPTQHGSNINTWRLLSPFSLLISHVELNYVFEITTRCMLKHKWLNMMIELISRPCLSLNRNTFSQILTWNTFKKPFYFSFFSIWFNTASLANDILQVDWIIILWVQYVQCI